MGAAWARTFHDLRPDTQRVVRACAVLGGSSISLVSAAALLDVSVADAAESLAVESDVGWGGVVDDRFDVAVDRRPYLRELVSATAADVLERVATAVLGALRNAVISPGVRGDVIGVLRAANEHRRPDLAAQVARAAWRSAAPENDLKWCGELAGLGEKAAITNKDPELLIELLDLSASTYSAAGDWQGAERAWLRALARVDDLGDATRFVHFLQLLATNYRGWGRPHKTTDMLLEIVLAHERDGDTAKAAEALAAVGTTMLDAGRLDAAVHYLGHADRLLQQLPGGDADLQAQHASVLGDLGRVHASRGAINTARTYYHQALALALDACPAGEDVAGRIRELQTALPSA